MEENEKNSLTLKEKIILIVLFIVVGAFLLYLVSNMEDTKTEEKEDTKVKEETKEEVTKVDPEIDNLYKDKNITSEKAYKLIEAKRTELKDDGWVVEYASITATKEDAVFVGYSELNKDGYEAELGLIMEYREGKWTFDLPGSNGFTDEQLKDFVTVQKADIYYGIGDEIAKYLIEAKRISLGYGTWTTKSAKFTEKGTNDYYLVNYVEKNNTSGEQELSTIFHFNRNTNKWEFTIPGSSGYLEGELDKYQFKEIEK